MFQFARTSAKAVLVAAGTAGFVALGAGVASADALGATNVVNPPSAAPTVAGLTAKADQVQRDAEAPHVAHTLPAPASAAHLTSEAENTLYTVQRTAELDDEVQQTAVPKAHGLAHKTVNSVPNGVLPEGTNGTVHKSLNEVSNAKAGAGDLTALNDEVPQAEVPEAEIPEAGVPGSGVLDAPEFALADLKGSVTGVAGPLVPQTDELGGELPEAGVPEAETPEADTGAVESKADQVQEDAAVELPEADTGAVEGAADQVQEDAAVELPEADTGAVEATEAVEDVDVEDVDAEDTVGDLPEVDTPSVPVL
ncbi:hypothetical protein [Allosalinactinospora lopnorensis]|uniref:hypothetical protein n=1 Tax=Allosalinactinospora lopnorensis TaxID=1352348 RepID=UPI000623D016|nr:hypothetical protein [Allosalinactinospora lopnorensis]